MRRAKKISFKGVRAAKISNANAFASGAKKRVVSFERKFGK